ncbi:hypothetical protein BDV93DRAFT_516188 [Ceratobasidium sp. AG-I]|nr:hypothetical protein BDV93DRAFT_516188 [Ceratobasidium sp. AG-I]
MDVAKIYDFRYSILQGHSLRFSLLVGRCVGQRVNQVVHKIGRFLHEEESPAHAQWIVRCGRGPRVEEVLTSRVATGTGEEYRIYEAKKMRLPLCLYLRKETTWELAEKFVRCGQSAPVGQTVGVEHIC